MALRQWSGLWRKRNKCKLEMKQIGTEARCHTVQFETFGKLCNLICAIGFGKPCVRTPSYAWQVRAKDKHTWLLCEATSLEPGMNKNNSNHKNGTPEGQKKHINHISISHRRPHTKGWRSPNSSVLASVIWNTTLCRSEIPTSMSSSMPTSSPEWHMTNRLTVMTFASSFVFSTMVIKPQ